MVTRIATCLTTMMLVQVWLGVDIYAIPINFDGVNEDDNYFLIGTVNVQTDTDQELSVVISGGPVGDKDAHSLAPVEGEPQRKWLLSVSSVNVDHRQGASPDRVTVVGRVFHREDVRPDIHHPVKGDNVDFEAVLKAGGGPGGLEMLKINGVDITPENDLTHDTDVFHQPRNHQDMYTFGLSETNNGFDMLSWKVTIDGIHSIPEPSSVAIAMIALTYLCASAVRRGLR